MKQILVYSDSIGWGMVPGTRQRLVIGQSLGPVVAGILGKVA